MVVVVPVALFETVGWLFSGRFGYSTRVEKAGRCKEQARDGDGGRQRVYKVDLSGDVSDRNGKSSRLNVVSQRI